MLGIFNVRLKRAISNFYLNHPFANFVYKQLILIIELILLCLKVNTFSLTLIILISSCILFNTIMLILGWIFKFDAFKISTELLEPASMMEIIDE